MNMKNTNFSLLEQLGIPSYERKFEDINLNYVFSPEEIERFCIKKMTTLAIISEMDLPYNIPAYNHLNIILVSITDVKFYNYLDEMYQKITSYCGSLCIVVFEKNGALKLGNCNGVKFVNKTPYFSEIVFSRWIYEDYITQKVYTFFSNFSTLLNNEDILLTDIYESIFWSIYNIKSEFLSEEQVKEYFKKNSKNKSKSPLFLDYVLSTSFSTYCQTEDHEPQLKYELSSVSRACKQFPA